MSKLYIGNGKAGAIVVCGLTNRPGGCSVKNNPMLAIETLHPIINKGEIVTTQTFTDTLVIEECFECHTSFGMTKSLYEQCRDNGRTFWCPNGHSQIYVTTEVQRLKRKMQKLHSRLSNMQESLSTEVYEHKKTRQSRAAVRGILTKTKKKLAQGHCPLCDQHFPDVENHMSDEHPDYVESE